VRGLNEELEEVLSMLLQLRWFGWVILLAMVGTLTMGQGQSRAQTLNEGWNVLEGKFKGGPEGLARGFTKGAKVDRDDKNHREAIDLLAKVYTYGVYLQKLEMKPNAIAKDFDAFSTLVDRDIARDPQGMQTFAEIFRDRVRVHALEVLQFPNARPIHKLHNARILAKVAKLGDPQLARVLIDVLKDPKQNDGVRYYMLDGLAALVPQLPPPQQAECATALVEFLKEKKGPRKNATPEEIEGAHVFRREAIRALAKIRTPVVNDKVRPALVLAQFAGNDASIQPPPRIDERVEAAIGLARMQAPKDKQYQVDYAAGQIGKCLGALAQEAESERANREMQAHPWKIYAAQLKEALEDLKKNNGNNNYVVQIATRGADLLNKVITGAQINANELTWWSSPQSDPPSKELFQGSADSAIKPGQPSEPEK
jgi:hypothetical protein